MQLKSQIKEALATVGDLNKSLQRKSKELEDIKVEMNEHIAIIEKKREDDVNMYRRRAEESEQKMREIESASSSESKRSKYIVDQLKEKYAAASQHFESKLDEERGNNKRLMNTIRYFYYGRFFFRL